MNKRVFNILFFSFFVTPFVCGMEHEKISEGLRDQLTLLGVDKEDLENPKSFLLHKAVEAGYWRVADACITAGHSIYTPNEKGQMPVHILHGKLKVPHLQFPDDPQILCATNACTAAVCWSKCLRVFIDNSKSRLPLNRSNTKKLESMLNLCEKEKSGILYGSSSWYGASDPPIEHYRFGFDVHPHRLHNPEKEGKVGDHKLVQEHFIAKDRQTSFIAMYNALLSAAHAGDETALKQLLAYGREKRDSPDVNCRKKFNWNDSSYVGFGDHPQLTPLSGAALMGRASVIKFLQKNGARIDEESEEGWCPLEYAAHGTPPGGWIWQGTGQSDAMQTLLDLGADPMHTDKKGNQVLTHAVYAGNPTAMLLMLGRGNSMTHLNDGGNTPAKALYGMLSKKVSVCAKGECTKTKCYTACLVPLVKYGLPLKTLRGLFVCDVRKPIIEVALATMEDSYQAHRLLSATGRMPKVDLDHVGGFDLVTPRERELQRQLDHECQMQCKFEDDTVMARDMAFKAVGKAKEWEGKYTQLVATLEEKLSVIKM